MLSGLLIKIIRFLFFHFTSPPPLVYLMFTPICHDPYRLKFINLLSI